MPQIDFYILPQAEREARFAFACRLIEKARGLGHRVYVHTANDDDAKQLDDLLWSYRPASFLPHNIVGNNHVVPNGNVVANGKPEQRSDIEIGCSGDASDHADVLINLSLTVPAFYERFARVTEIVVQEPAVLNATRQSWKFYSDKGIAINRHDMRK